MSTQVAQGNINVFGIAITVNGANYNITEGITEATITFSGEMKVNVGGAALNIATTQTLTGTVAAILLEKKPKNTASNAIYDGVVINGKQPKRSPYVDRTVAEVYAPTNIVVKDADTGDFVNIPIPTITGVVII